MFLWRKLAGQEWVKAHQGRLEAHAPGQLVIVQKAGRKRLELEVVCCSQRDSSALLKEFGGRVEALPRNWLRRFERANSKPIRIGARLAISSVEETPVSRRSRHKGRSHIIIPASLAFGTGEHATTAMSLRLLERLTRKWNPGWSFVDLGTGSGILALAAKCLGAGRVTGIDIDPTAISVAKANGRLNKILGASFQVGDVRKWNLPAGTDVITANLYCDLLVEILPKLKVGAWLILSGVLRRQQDELVHGLQRNGYELVSEKRRGKWAAILASRGPLRDWQNLTHNFCGRDRPPLK